MKIEDPVRYAHSQAQAMVETTFDEEKDDMIANVAARDPVVHSVRVEGYSYGTDEIIEEVAVVTNALGVEWWLTRETVSRDAVPEHVRDAALDALVED